MTINNRPLQRTAWDAFHTARKRLDKISRDLRRHEEVDTPAYHAWLHTTFPRLVTDLRRLHAEVSLKQHQIATVQYLAAISGRSLKKVWREFQENLANPRAPEPDPDADHTREPRGTARAHREDAADEDDDFDHDGDHSFENDNDAPERSASSEVAAPAPDARDIYRRLVQHLHPDRGGEWTPARERLWHEVQQAWAARDADWLARLEINWETAHNLLSADSSLDRLRTAIAELKAAHRDIDRKLRDYRRSHEWRFTLSEKKRPQFQRRVETELTGERDYFQRQLDHLDATIAAWEEPLPRARR
jgi:hypothetical protein